MSYITCATTYVSCLHPSLRYAHCQAASSLHFLSRSCLQCNVCYHHFRLSVLIHRVYCLSVILTHVPDDATVDFGHVVSRPYVLRACPMSRIACLLCCNPFALTITFYCLHNVSYGSLSALSSFVLIRLPRMHVFRLTFFSRQCGGCPPLHTLHL